MATTAGPRIAPPTSRRTSSVSSVPSAPIARGATARSAVNPRVSANITSPSRRGSIKAATPPPLTPGTREALAESLKHETEQKEQLLVQLQNKEQSIATLTEENGHMSSALNAAEIRLNELYTEQNRMEEEMAARIEVAEKLRSQVRELEKEKRDVHRRYNEQTSSFEAERQAFYDNEQHLKSRIQSLTHTRRNPPVPPSPSIVVDQESEAEAEDEDDEIPPQPMTPSREAEDQDSEPAEMTALRLELSTLSTSYASLQNTLVHLQTQLVDLKRVNNGLQEENESYNILLRERTLNGQFDLMRQMGADSAESSDQESDEQEDEDVGSMQSGTRSHLDTLNEHPDETLDPEYSNVTDGEEKDNEEKPDADDAGSRAGSARNRSSRRRHGGSISHSPTAPRGESLADLPITGPGLDLAAELGRAENKDILDGRVDDRSVNNKGKRGKKGSSEANKKTEATLEPSGSSNDVDAMKSKIKSLEDANKALSLYASKIIDRIIAQEGFEHVLAIDYDKSPQTPSTATLHTGTVRSDKGKRRNTMFARSAPTPTSPQPERLTTFNSPPLSGSANSSAATSPTLTSKPQRRSMSFDWRGFSLFGGDKKLEPNPNLRPLTLQAGAAKVTGARKLETHEDDEDRRERERLHATMKLMGIEKPNAPPIIKSYSTPDPAPLSSPLVDDVSSAASSPPSRFSFFRRSAVTSDASSTKSAPSSGQNGLTQEALVHAEAENTIAALEAREQALSVEMAKGLSGGFTEIGPRRKSGSRRSRTSGGGSGSGSTVWSAGMSRTGEEGDD
ncbi:hypothetical protein OF83DRAFT_1140906 [Amylostereum chailletii]|nr:hypothetical protein OF83DRAFT_1140906 [Amylostereum chailletii]